jgi:hypothetical protein
MVRTGVLQSLTRLALRVCVRECACVCVTGISLEVVLVRQGGGTRRFLGYKLLLLLVVVMSVRPQCVLQLFRPYHTLHCSIFPPTQSLSKKF